MVCRAYIRTTLSRHDEPIVGIEVSAAGPCGHRISQLGCANGSRRTLEYHSTRASRYNDFLHSTWPGSKAHKAIKKGAVDIDEESRNAIEDACGVTS